MATPMFIVTGFLDSGKTTMIKDTLMEQEWIEPGLTLLLLCEEGEEEYPEEYLKEKKKSVKIVAVEPSDSPVLSKGTAGPHKIQGIGAGFVPTVLNTQIYDEIMPITAEKSFETAKLFAHKEGILVGISSGAALYAAIEQAKREENKGKTIVALLPDSGDRYYSTPLFES